MNYPRKCEFLCVKMTNVYKNTLFLLKISSIQHINKRTSLMMVVICTPFPIKKYTSQILFLLFSVDNFFFTIELFFCYFFCFQKMYIYLNDKYVRMCELYIYTKCFVLNVLSCHVSKCQSFYAFVSFYVYFLRHASHYLYHHRDNIIKYNKMWKWQSRLFADKKKSTNSSPTVILSTKSKCTHFCICVLTSNEKNYSCMCTKQTRTFVKTHTLHYCSFSIFLSL